MKRESQWLFETLFSPELENRSRHSSAQPAELWLFEVPTALPEADYMAGKRRKGTEHTNTSGGSKTRTKGQHQKGQQRQGSQNKAADLRNQQQRAEAERRKRERAKALTHLEKPSQVQVLALIQAKETEQVQVKSDLAIAQQRRDYQTAKELREKFLQLEKHIKDLKQLRLEVR
jgi:hypothetical protein